MNNIKDFLIGLTVNFLAQVAVFFQLQGSIKIEFLKNNYWLVVLSGIPISMLFMAATKYMVQAFDGQMWPSRLIGFSVGTIVFVIMSWGLFREPFTVKTSLCLSLALVILLIQIFWK